MGLGMLDTSTVILLGRIADPATLPDQSVISTIRILTARDIDTVRAHVRARRVGAQHTLG